MKKPTNKILDAIDMQKVDKYWKNFPNVENGDKNYMNYKSGDHHYRLLSWFSMQFDNSNFSEIGTLDGMGLISLCYNPSNMVKSYDIFDNELKYHIPPNGERVICERDFNYYDEVFKSEFIFYDAGHGGVEEMEFLKRLLDMGYKGVLAFDDIYFNNEMIEFWKKASQIVKVQDWTDIGNKFGTGVIILK